MYTHESIEYCPCIMASYSFSPIRKTSTIYRETFKGENFHEFRGFVAICKSFLLEIWGRGII